MQLYIMNVTAQLSASPAFNSGGDLNYTSPKPSSKRVDWNCSCQTQLARWRTFTGAWRAFTGAWRAFTGALAVQK